MYRHNQKQLTFHEFALPFGGALNPKNRWVIKASLIPWDFVEEVYVQSLKETNEGRGAKSARTALAAMIIQQDQKLTDEEVVLHIEENPYMQFFCGFEEFQQKKPFDPSLMVHFRKRFPADIINQVNEEMLKRQKQSESESDDDNNDSSNHDEASPSGKLIIDATCAPADIHYPTDVHLLNHARLIAEGLVDKLYEELKYVYTQKDLFTQASDFPYKSKPRTYRIKARKNYLSFAKKKRPGKKRIRQTLRKQLSYLKRDIAHIHDLLNYVELSCLFEKELKNLWVIQHVYAQQQYMYENKVHKVADRIVSIDQPHIRRIVRGKSGSDVEFGAKLSISVTEDGYVYCDKISWDSHNESTDFKEVVENYRQRFGHYPKAVYADQIYRTRENRRFCKKLGIRISGPRLGAKPKNEELSKKQRAQEKKDVGIRNWVESKFGQCKRRFGLNRIMGKLPQTSESMISLCLLVANLAKICCVLNFEPSNSGNTRKTKVENAVQWLKSSIHTLICDPIRNISYRVSIPIFSRYSKEVFQ